MIDTDKYKGHLAYLEYELWAFTEFMNINATHEERCATDALLNDAPLLLAEVERLRDLVEFAIATIDSNHCYMGEEAQVDLRDYLKEAIE
jgi:hypothetical protein|tara:strand:- start:515 stop:784 length:270 start_codon:yes stop_codon:yes gene_type:complete